MFKVSERISKLIQIWLEYFRKNPRPSWRVFGQGHVTFAIRNTKSKFEKFIFFEDSFPGGHDDYISFSILFEASRHANDICKVFRSIIIQICSNTSWIRSKQSEIFLKLFEQGKAAFFVQIVRPKFEKFIFFKDGFLDGRDNYISFRLFPKLLGM